MLRRFTMKVVIMLSPARDVFLPLTTAVFLEAHPNSLSPPFLASLYSMLRIHTPTNQTNGADAFCWPRVRRNISWRLRIIWKIFDIVTFRTRPVLLSTIRTIIIVHICGLIHFFSLNCVHTSRWHQSICLSSMEPPAWKAPCPTVNPLNRQSWNSPLPILPVHGRGTRATWPLYKTSGWVAMKTLMQI